MRRYVLKLLLVQVFLFLFQSCVAQKIKSVQEWENSFLSIWNDEYIKAGKQSESNDSWQFYNLAYYIDGNTTMFQATGKTKYLDRALFYINNMIDSARPSKSFQYSQYKDNFLGWVNHSSPGLGNNGKEYPLYESYCWRYVTYLLRILDKSPSLLSDTKYKNQYDKILNFTKENIYNKWATRGKSNIYRSNTHMFSHWARIAVDLWEITGETKYSVVFKDFNLKMKAQFQSLTTNNKTLVTWCAPWGKRTGVYQDVNHGNAVIGTIIEMYELNVSYNRNDIDHLINLINNIIWKDKNNYAEYFDGSGKGTGWFTDGFIKLGRYNKELQIKIENHKKGRTTQFFGNGALNAIILTKGKPVYPESY